MGQTKFCLRVCHVNKNKPIVVRYDRFSANAAFRFAYLIETTLQGIGRSLARYSCLMLRSLFPTNDNNNSEYSNQLNKTLYWQATIQPIFFVGGRHQAVCCDWCQLSININYNRQHLFFKNQSFSGVGGSCSYVFANCAFHLFLICYNILWWTGGSLTRSPKDPFAVSWPRQLDE